MLVLLIVSLPVAAACFGTVSRMREDANRLGCVANLRQIGWALQVYANENMGRSPRTRFDGAEAMTPTAYTGVRATNPFDPGGPKANDVTGGLFLLLRDGSLTADVFVCPSDPEAAPWDYGGRTATAFSSFRGRQEWLFS